MSDPFLEEQLKRLRQMSQRISEAHNKVRDFGKPASVDRPAQGSAHGEHRAARRSRATPRRR